MPIEVVLALFVLIIGLLIIGSILGCCNTPKHKGARGEKLVADRLRKGLPEEYLIFNGIYLPLPDGTTTQIDHVVICRYGIFVIETKCYSGWIFGNETSPKWTQTIYHNKNSFQNPIRQNYRHICALSDNLHIPKKHFTSVVVFAGNCEFKTEMPQGVVYSCNAADFIRSFNSPRIKADQVAAISFALMAKQEMVDKDRKAAHVYNLKRRRLPIAKDSAPPKCPLCGSEMVIRKRKSDGVSFYGCRHYPKCRGIMNITQDA